AQRWLNRLIAVDRSNEEARQQLARIETAKQQPVAADANVATDAKPPAPTESTLPAPTEQAAEPVAAQAEPKPTPASPSVATPPEAKLPESKAQVERPPDPEPAQTKSAQDGPVDLTADIAEPEASSELQF